MCFLPFPYWKPTPLHGKDALQDAPKALQQSVEAILDTKLVHLLLETEWDNWLLGSN